MSKSIQIALMHGGPARLKTRAGRDYPVHVFEPGRPVEVSRREADLLMARFDGTDRTWGRARIFEFTGNFEPEPVRGAAQLEAENAELRAQIAAQGEQMARIEAMLASLVGGKAAETKADPPADVKPEPKPKPLAESKPPAESKPRPAAHAGGTITSADLPKREG